MDQAFSITLIIFAAHIVKFREFLSTSAPLTSFVSDSLRRGRTSFGAKRGASSNHTRVSGNHALGSGAHEG
jgi:hypothetical protein